jgi:signal transduction histidine kinase
MPRAKNSKISIREQANNMVSLYENTENVTIQLEDYTEGIYYVYADASQISRVLNNLLKNAIQSIPRSREGKVIVSLQKTDHRVLISVADNGEGIPENIRGKLFAPNFTTKSSGMGMGLAISRKIVEDSGGKIWYETKMQQGTTFYVELPIYGNSAQDADL